MLGKTASGDENVDVGTGLDKATATTGGSTGGASGRLLLGFCAGLDGVEPKANCADASKSLARPLLFRLRGFLSTMALHEEDLSVLLLSASPVATATFDLATTLSSSGGADDLPKSRWNPLVNPEDRLDCCPK